MAFWSTEKIKDVQKRGNKLIEPFHPELVKHGAYELKLGDYLITDSPSSRFQYSGTPETIEIPPGHFALLLTEEEVFVPNNTLAFLSIKASVKLDGLVNVSGFHVDPGFKGKLKFSVHNASSNAIHLHLGAPTFLIWFADLDQTTSDPYTGKSNGQTTFSREDMRRMNVDVASPASLLERIKRLDDAYESAKLFALFVFLPLAIALLAAAVPILWDICKKTPPH